MTLSTSEVARNLYLNCLLVCRILEDNMHAYKVILHQELDKRILIVYATAIIDFLTI